jgi:uroporphyrinogen decarboxylase
MPVHSIDSDKPLLRALRGQAESPVPVWLMRQAGRYLAEYREVRERAGGFLDLCYSPALAAEVTLQPVRRFGMDAAILFSDILVVPHALGTDVTFRSGDGPRVAPIAETCDIPEFVADRFHEHLAPVYETVRRVAAALPDGVALIGFAGAPWTVATYMVEGGTSRDFAKTKLWAARDRAGFAALIEVIVEATASYLIEQVRNGAEALQLFDSWAGAVAEEDFERLCIAPTRAIVERVRSDCGAVPIIGFPRGAGLSLIRYAGETGVDAVSIDSGVPVGWAADALQPHWVVQGNLDPLQVVAGGETMVAAARRILDALGGGPFVFNLGHGIVPQTPPGNVALLVDTVHGWRP